jgi:hypothetical protein
MGEREAQPLQRDSGSGKIQATEAHVIGLDCTVRTPLSEVARDCPSGGLESADCLLQGFSIAAFRTYPNAEEFGRWYRFPRFDFVDSETSR